MLNRWFLLFCFCLSTNCQAKNTLFNSSSSWLYGVLKDAESWLDNPSIANYQLTFEPRSNPNATFTGRINLQQQNSDSPLFGIDLAFNSLKYGEQGYNYLSLDNLTQFNFRNSEQHSISLGLSKNDSGQQLMLQLSRFNFQGSLATEQFNDNRVAIVFNHSF